MLQGCLRTIRAAGYLFQWAVRYPHRAQFRLLGPHLKQATFLPNYALFLRFNFVLFCCNEIVRGMHEKKGFQRGQELRQFGRLRPQNCGSVAGCER